MGKSKWKADNIGPQNGRVAIVTGANSGIGFETASALASKGARVVLACRSAERAAEACKKIALKTTDANIAAIELNLGSLKSVSKFADEFNKKYERLDILINNAGVMIPPYSKTEEGFELQIGTNHFGHFALTGLLFKRLIENPGSRIVVVSSFVERVGRIDFDDLNWEKRPYKKWAAYGQSKLANLLFAYELARKVKKSNRELTVAAAHPGWTATNLQKHLKGADFFGQILAMKPWQGALPTLFAATFSGVENGDYIGPAGIGQLRGYPKKVRSSARSYDLKKAEKLFEISKRLTGVVFE